MGFELKLPAMTGLWPGGRLQQITVERRIASTLRDQLQQTFHYWTFTVATQEKSPPGTPRIMFRLHEEMINEALLTLELDVEGHPPLVLNAVLWSPAQFQKAALVTPSSAQHDIPGYFSKQLILANRDAIQRRLMESVPLAEGKRDEQWLLANPRTLVLPLSFDRYGDLRESEFRLVCEKKSAVTRLIVVGTGKSYRFPGKKSAEALAAFLYTLQEGNMITPNPSRTVLIQNTLRYVYLNEYRVPSKLKEGSLVEAEP